MRTSEEAASMACCTLAERNSAARTSAAAVASPEASPQPEITSKSAAGRARTREV
ncbi:MAG: hypothetical protein M5U28_41195 [Sandaracinaceae bacterium]|nr:hypothetical protein [Sandaracinaceae bacterium]